MNQEFFPCCRQECTNRVFFIVFQYISLCVSLYAVASGAGSRFVKVTAQNIRFRGGNRT